ncbi:hypothetical protein OSTOST_15545 [Ostertagia ostertagi]
MNSAVSHKFQAPQGKRVLVNIVQVHGRCVEGCWEDGVEFKMSNDVRPVGYRFCCQQAYQRRILSRSNIVPFIVTSRNTGMSLTFEYTYAPSQITDIVNKVEMEDDGLTTTIATVV